MILGDVGLACPVSRGPSVPQLQNKRDTAPYVIGAVPSRLQADRKTAINTFTLTTVLRPSHLLRLDILTS